MSQKNFLAILFSSLAVIILASIFFYTANSGVFIFENENTIPSVQADEKPIITEEEFDIEELDPEPDELTLLFTGDMMLDRSVLLKTQAAEDWFWPFRNLDYFQHYDLRIGNLEGSVTDFKSIANGTGGDRFYFTFSPNFLEPLKTYFDVVSLANNHTNNFGKKGLEQSRNYLDESGISYFGDPNNAEDYLSVIVEKNDIKIGFVGFHELIGYGFDRVLAEIKALHTQVDFLVAFPHWGVEYNTQNPTYNQRQEAHQMLDAGADTIIGSHPHVIQPVEEYEGKLIFYSLGNFIFDQYFSTETQQGLNIAITLEKDFDETNIGDVEIIPIVISNQSQPSLAPEQTKQTILESLAKVSPTYQINY